MLNKSCPGSIGLKQARPEELPCPNCHHMVEIWSDELRRRCGNCGAVVTRELGNSCILWCSAARECVGDQLYDRLMSQQQAAKQGVP